jgi:hypothetical protein
VGIKTGDVTFLTLKLDYYYYYYINILIKKLKKKSLNCMGGILKITPSQALPTAHCPWPPPP